MVFRRRYEWLQLLGLLLLVAVVIESVDGWLSRRDFMPGVPGERSSPSDLAPSDLPDVVITGFEFLHTSPEPASRPIWSLTAGAAELLERQRAAELRDLRATFTPEGEQSDVVLSGERGRIDLQRMNFEVIGVTQPLSLQLADQYRLTTSRLVWENAAGSLATDQPVRLTGKGLTMTGTGLRWSLPDGTVSILHQVETVIVPL
ncbi:MAG: LPS export ABC transporter periplasmic protein LptC [Nitrospirota bacterium]